MAGCFKRYFVKDQVLRFVAQKQRGVVQRKNPLDALTLRIVDKITSQFLGYDGDVIASSEAIFAGQEIASSPTAPA